MMEEEVVDYPEGNISYILVVVMSGIPLIVPEISSCYTLFCYAWKVKDFFKHMTRQGYTSSHIYV